MLTIQATLAGGTSQEESPFQEREAESAWLLPTVRVTAPQKKQRASPLGKALTQARSPLQSLKEGTLLFLLATSYPTAVRRIKSPPLSPWSSDAQDYATTHSGRSMDRRTRSMNASRSNS